MLECGKRCRRTLKPDWFGTDFVESVIAKRCEQGWAVSSVDQGYEALAVSCGMFIFRGWRRSWSKVGLDNYGCQTRLTPVAMTEVVQLSSSKDSNIERMNE